jgi:hypothetical protein
LRATLARNMNGSHIERSTARGGGYVRLYTYTLAEGVFKSNKPLELKFILAARREQRRTDPDDDTNHCDGFRAIQPEA